MSIRQRILESTAPRARWWPRVRLVMSVLILAAGVVAAVDRRQQLVQAAHRVNRLQVGWLVVAVAFEAVSMLVFADLQRVLLRQGGVHVPRRDIVEITLAANAMALSVPGGAAVSTGWSYAELRRRGVERVLAGWAVLMAGALSSFALFLTLAVGSWLAGSSGPVAALRWLALSLACIPAAGAVLLVLRERDPRVRRWLGAQASRLHLTRLVEQVRIVRPSARGWVQSAVMAGLNWGADAGCLAASIYAVGAGVPWRGILVAYGLAQLAAVLPFTPGGLAIVEASLTAILVAYGMQTGNAIAAVLVYRVISFWAVVPIGWVCYGLLSFADRAGEHHWGSPEAHAT